MGFGLTGASAAHPKRGGIIKRQIAIKVEIAHSTGPRKTVRFLALPETGRIRFATQLPGNEKCATIVRIVPTQACRFRIDDLPSTLRRPIWNPATLPS
jgi:hypothetical protein